MPTWAEAGLADMSGTREIVTATAAALIFSFVLSWGAVYGLNRYLDRYLGPSADPYETTGTAGTLQPSD